MNTAVHGINIKAALAPTGDDARDVANVATTSRNAVQSYAVSHTKYLVITVAMSIWKPNVITYGSSQSGIFTPTKSQCQYAVRIAAVLSILWETAQLPHCAPKSESHRHLLLSLIHI